MHRYPIQFVGAGPGDPDLITVKGMRALQSADLVIYAGSLVPEALLQWTRSECRSVSSASMHLDEFISMMAAAYEQGERVVRLHTGDPSLYGALAEQITELKKRSIPFEIIPGVTAAFAAAAALGIEYTLPGRTQTLILTRMAGRTPTPESESFESLARHRSSMAIYLSAALSADLSEILQKTYGKGTPAAVVYRVSQPEEKIIRTTVEQLPEVMTQEGIRKTALILVGEAIDPSSDSECASKLYDRTFSHEFRKAEVEK